MGSFTSVIALGSKACCRMLVLSMVVLGLSGCGTQSVKAPWSNEPEPDFDLIAANLVNSLSQFPHLNPLLATVQVAEPRTEFDRQVQEELDNRGYKLEMVTGAKGLNQVKPQVKQIDADAANQKLYVLNVGQVSVERAYSIVDEKTLPASALVIRGAKERNINLNDDIFADADEQYASVAFEQYEGPRIDDVLAAPGSQKKRFWEREKRNAVKKNIYETMTSNYKDVFAGYEDLEQSILVFPNDSLRLGDANKQIIEQYVAKMNPETDLVSVIGCSHGNTEISNGNSLLALGRANRVKEALMFSGLEHTQILEEGCWAPQTFDEVMPRRGVVLTLKRMKNS